MPRTTTTLYRIHLRVNQPREKILEEICELAKQENIQLEPQSSRTIWWGLERTKWAYHILKQQEKKELEYKKMLGRL